MSENEFLNKLQDKLVKMEIPRWEDIIRDYREHFANGKTHGRSEEEIAKNLGDPDTLAKAFEVERVLKPHVNEPSLSPLRFVGATTRLLVITPFNFLVLIGPALLVFILLLVGWILSLGFAGVSFVATMAALVISPALLINFWMVGSIIFAALSTFFFSLIVLLIMWVFSQMVTRAFTSYLKWNVDFVLQKK